MKRFALLAILLVSTTACSFDELTEAGRFEEFNVRGTSTYLLRDNKTGCEYIRAGQEGGWTLLEGTCNTK